jgi:DNA adenine methylase
MSNNAVSPPLKWHGGKGMMASKIVALMPKRLHYVEPYAGGLSVLLAKDPEGVSEVVNDLNEGLATFWRVLQDPTTFEAFRRRVEATPFAEQEWHDSMWAKHFADISETEQAVAFFIRCRQSLAGRMKSFTGVTKTRTRRGMNNEVSAWLTAVEGLPAVHARLKRVLILNRPALDVIRGQDGPDTLFYLDPPYLHETRTAPDVYAHEMTKSQHIDLLAALRGIRGKFLLSGYRSELYDGYATAEGWHRTDFEMANHSAGGKTKRRMVECVWSNFKPEGAA